MRFDKNVRILANLMFSLIMILILPVVLYVPAVAFNQVTGMPVYVVSVIITIACLFYTAFGGLKAVLWTDALQNMFMYFAALFVCVLGCIKLGGLQEVWRINQDGHRIEVFNMDPNPFARNTFLTVTIGCIFLYLTNMSTHPGTIQRFLAVPSLTHARWVIFWGLIAFYVIINMSNFMGMILYARYHDCDPVASGVIKNYSQLVPLYIMEISKNYPGLAGLFMSGVLSATLSTMSSWLNTMGGFLYTDVMEICFPHVQHSEAKQSRIIKLLVIILGVVVAALVQVVEKLGTVVQVAVTFCGLVYGSILSLYTLGIFFPRVNTKGAVVGTISSLFITGWVGAHAQYYIMTGKIQFPGKITSIENCPSSIAQQLNLSHCQVFNYTGVGSPVVVDDSVPLLYQISYNYYVLIGSLTGIILGLTVSFLTHPPDLSNVNPDLFSPYVHRFLPKKVVLKSHPDKHDYILSNLHENCKIEDY